VKGEEGMLKDMHWKYVNVISSGSVYPFQSGKQTMAFAFYYKVANGSKARKVVSGNSMEELKKKAVQFLDRKEMEYSSELEKAEEIRKEQERPKTFREVGEQWFQEYSAKRMSYASKESRLYSLKGINKIIGDMFIKDIDNTVAKDLISRYSQKENGKYYSRSYVDKMQQVFLMVMTYAKNAGYCTNIPDKRELGKELSTVDKDSRFLDEEQILLVHKAVENNLRYKTIFHFLLATGLRQEEAFALNIKDFHAMRDGNIEVKINKTVVETENHVYAIENKTKTLRSKRSVFISKEIYDMLMEYYHDVKQHETDLQKQQREKNGMEGYIFLNKEMKPINKRTFQRNFKDYIKRNGGADIDFNVTLHMFRHTFASIQADYMGIDKVAMLMGDSITTTSNMYQSLTNKTKSTVCESSTKLYKSIISQENN